MRNDYFAMKNQVTPTIKQKCSNDMVSLSFVQPCELAYYKYIKLYDTYVYVLTRHYLPESFLGIYYITEIWLNIFSREKNVIGHMRFYYK